MASKDDVQHDRKQSVLENWFRLHLRGASISSEFIASVGTVLISIFSMIATANLISHSITNGSQLLPTLLTLVFLVSGILSIAAGLISKLPLVFIGSLGINQFISVNVINALSLDWGYGFAVLILENIIWIVLSFTRFPTWCTEQLPAQFKQLSLVTLGGIFFVFGIFSGKVVQFNANQEVISYTLRSTETFIFCIVFIITFVLHQLKVKGAYVYGFLLALFLGMYIPKVPDRVFNQGYFWILVLMLVVWMIVYATLVDYRKKNALDISMIVLLLGLMIGLIWTRNPGAIIPLPSKWIGQQGFIGRPRFQNLGSVIGYPIFSFPSMLKEFSKLIRPLISLFLVHWVTFIGFMEVLPEYVSFRKKDQETYFKKYAFFQEGVMGLVGNHTGTGMNSSVYGSVIAWLNGAKTGLSSVFTGIGFLGLLFFIPFLRTSFTAFSVGPVMAVIGAQMILKVLQTYTEDKNIWVAILIALLVGGLTLNFYQGVLSGMLVYGVDKLIHGKTNEINAYFWILMVIALVFSFIRVNIPYLPIVNF
ncbi:hypothetical protein LLG10_02590 [bacterium]|nr:hypothetical protein [bacterium]